MKLFETERDKDGKCRKRMPVAIPLRYGENLLLYNLYIYI